MKNINKKFICIIISINIFTIFISGVYLFFYFNKKIIKNEKLFIIINFLLIFLYLIILLIFSYINRKDKNLFKEEIIIISLYIFISLFIFLKLYLSKISLIETTIFLVIFSAIHLNIVENYDFIKYLKEVKDYE